MTEQVHTEQSLTLPIHITMAMSLLDAKAAELNAHKHNLLWTFLKAEGVKNYEGQWIISPDNSRAAKVAEQQEKN